MIMEDSYKSDNLYPQISETQISSRTYAIEIQELFTGKILVEK